MTWTVRQQLRSTRSRRPRWRGAVIAVVVILALLVALDFAAKAAAERIIASKIQQRGLQHRPDVTIDGFPFLTQVAAKDFRQISLTAVDQTEGPVTITRISATGRDITIGSYSFNSGTIGSLSGTALISFGSLSATLVREVGPLGSLLRGAGLQLSAAGPDEIRATLNLLVTTGSATWRVSRLPGDRLNIHLVRSSGVPASLLGVIENITLQIPKLPLGLTIKSVQVTPSGVVGRVSAVHVPFGS